MVALFCPQPKLPGSEAAPHTVHCSNLIWGLLAHGQQWTGYPSPAMAKAVLPTQAGKGTPSLWGHLKSHKFGHESLCSSSGGGGIKVRCRKLKKRKVTPNISPHPLAVLVE